MVFSHRFEMKMLLNLFLFIDHHVVLIIRVEKDGTSDLGVVESRKLNHQQLFLVKK